MTLRPASTLIIRSSEDVQAPFTRVPATGRQALQLAWGLRVIPEGSFLGKSIGHTQPAAPDLCQGLSVGPQGRTIVAEKRNDIVHMALRLDQGPLGRRGPLVPGRQAGRGQSSALGSGGRPGLGAPVVHWGPLRRRGGQSSNVLRGTNHPTRTTTCPVAETCAKVAPIRTVYSRAPGVPAVTAGGGALRPLTHRTHSSSSAVAEACAQETLFHTLPSGLKLEVVRQGAAEAAASGTRKAAPPLLFVHGSYHAAWCWAQHWMPFFSDRGFDCFAISLIGQGKSDSPDAPVAGTLQSHAADLSHLIQSVIGRPPVLIGHSFGGLVVQAYLNILEGGMPPESEGHVSEGEGAFAPLEGAALVCSVPPSGNKDLVMRFLRTRPIMSLKITLSLAAKMFATSASLCRDSFFSEDVPEATVKRYQALMATSSRLPLFDLRKLNSSLPVPRPASPRPLPPLLVVGAERDNILDFPGLQETAEYYGITPVVVPNVAHDLMLDTNWAAAADTVLAWLKEDVLE